jgi:hypothetical protein
VNLPENGSADCTITNTVIVVSPEADLKVTSVSIDCPDEAQTDTPFTCDVSVTVHNNGPASPVDGELTVDLTPPFDCVPVAPASLTQVINVPDLVTSTSQVIDLEWEVECDNFSFHMFTTEAEIQPEAPTVDNVPGNNSGMDQDTTPVSAPTDIKATSVTVSMPPSYPANQPFQVDVSATIHNNGPIQTSEIIVNVGIGVPPDCTRSPDGFQAFGTTPIELSVDLVVNKSWQVTCSQPGLHVIIGCASAIITQLHATDPNGLNNGSSDQDTIIIGGDSTPAGQRSCTVPGDPPENCWDGIDNDGDGLIDEEPDRDKDGLTDCEDDDDDDDGFPDVLEEYVGTDPLNPCPRGPFDNAWPVDVDNSQAVDILDVLKLKPVFGLSGTDANFLPRTDINADSSIDILDVLALKPYFKGNCAN